MSLFGGANSQADSRNLVEFKAGKMTLRGSMVYPDKRKGLLYLYQGNDMLMHFCWKDRSNNRTEDDFVIFPDEVDYKKVTQNTTGRVYILKWKTNSRKLFFWMQEPSADKDEELCKKINHFLNHPPALGISDDGSANPLLQPFIERMVGNSGLDVNSFSNALRHMDPNELASIFGSLGAGSTSGVSMTPGQRRSRGPPSGSTQPTIVSRPYTAPATTQSLGTATVISGNRGAGSSLTSRNNPPSSTTSTTTPKTTNKSTTSGGSKTNPIQMSALANALTNLGNKTAATTETATPSSTSAVSLCDIMNTENLVPLLANKDVQEKLRAHLPEGTSVLNTEKELKEAIQSPQFRQAVDAFSTALQSGELGPVLVQFNFPDEVIQAANRGDLQEFARTLEKYYKKSNESNAPDNNMDTN